VLADGTVLEGFGLGAEGQAVGEVCFNTAMTGYEEILTDPSYAGQIITFTFPHIGNVGTNEEDIETVNMAATPGARGVILRSAITDPSNYRATKHLDQWLKARGIIGLSGIDTRALTALIRSKGMPNAVIAHSREGQFDLHGLKEEAREWPGWRAWTSCRWSPPASALPGTRRPGCGTRVLAGRAIRSSTSSPSTTASSATSCACSPASAAR
jgi:carbamoyl-phosphate synthase small subunit